MGYIRNHTEGEPKHSRPKCALGRNAGLKDLSHGLIHLFHYCANTAVSFSTELAIEFHTVAVKSLHESSSK